MKVRDVVSGSVKREDLLDEEVFAVEDLDAGDCFRIAENAVAGVGAPYLVLGEGNSGSCVDVYEVGDMGKHFWATNLVIKISEKEFLEYEQSYGQ